MPIPWLVGGAVVAAASVIAAAVSDKKSSESSTSLASDQERDQERKLKKEQMRKETAVKEKDLKNYTCRIAKNLVQKYRNVDQDVIHKKLEPLLKVSNLDNLGLSEEVKSVSQLVELTDNFQYKNEIIESLEDELEDLEQGVLLLEMLNEKFK
ncbi:hypothetical protein ACLUEY_09820 [Vreelandella aquamarina]